jgi:hypothetical protein
MVAAVLLLACPVSIAMDNPIAPARLKKAMIGKATRGRSSTSLRAGSFRTPAFARLRRGEPKASRNKETFPLDFARSALAVRAALASLFESLNMTTFCDPFYELLIILRLSPAESDAALVSDES